MPPGTVVSTEVTAGIVGLVRSVRVVGVLEGLMEALDISEAGPDGVPHCSVDPSDALSTQEPSCRSRFLRNFARAFWNQTCRGTKKGGEMKPKTKQRVTKGHNWTAHFHCTTFHICSPQFPSFSQYASKKGPKNRQIIIIDPKWQ